MVFILRCLSIFCGLFFLLNANFLVAQEDGKKKLDITLGGYLKYLHTVSFNEAADGLVTDNLLHNRLNMKWYANDNFTVAIEARTRLLYGESITLNPAYGKNVTQNINYLELGGEIASGKSYFLHSYLDRAYVDYTKGDWQIRAGRQRLNWGKGFVWNPNDWFNAANFFDFDYEERPGMDGFLLRKYTGELSSIELAVALEEDFDNMTIASKYGFNKWNYDFQVLAGKVKRDVALGIGWAGEIKGAGFTGEISYFHPYDTDTVGNTFNTDTTLLAAIDFDYTFENSLALRLGGMYNSSGELPQGQNFFTTTLTAKNLTFNNFSLFGSLNYPLTPLINTSFSTMWNVDDKSFFLGPNFTFSLNNNIDLFLNAQVFIGDEESTFGGNGGFLFGRLKWGF